MSEIKEGARVLITQQYVNNVGLAYKEEAKTFVGLKGTAREERGGVWDVELDEKPRTDDCHWLFYPHELKLIS